MEHDQQIRIFCEEGYSGRPVQMSCYDGYADTVIADEPITCQQIGISSMKPYLLLVHIMI